MQSDQRLKDISKSEKQDSPKKKIYLPQLVSTRINADDQTEFKICFYPLIFVVILIILSLVSSLVLPNALINVDSNTWKSGNIVHICKDHLQLNQIIIRCIYDNYKYTKIGSYVTGLVPLNQFLVLYLSINQGYYKDSTINLNQNVNFTFYTAQTSDDYIIATSQVISRKLSLSGPINQVFPDGKIFILYVSKLSQDQQFYWQLQFSNNSQIAPTTYFLQSQVVNAQFSLFTIVLRVVLFIISLGFLLRFNRLITKIPKGKVSIEQGMIKILSVLNLTFNDQLYFISVISPNPFSSFLS